MNNAGGRFSTGIRSSLVHRCHQFKYRSTPHPPRFEWNPDPYGRDDRLPGLHEPLDDTVVRIDPIRGSYRQLSSSSRHLEQPRSSKFDESLFTELEPGGYTRFVRFHANRSRRDPSSARHLDPRTSHV